MDAFLDWLLKNATGDNLLSVGILAFLAIAGRAVWWWGFRDRSKENPNDVGVLTEYYETGTQTLKENARNIAVLTQVVGSIKQDTTELVERQCPIIGKPADSGIHGR